MDDEKKVAEMTYIKGGTNERFITPIVVGEELMVLQDDEGLWVVSKEGTRFVHLCKLFPGDKVTIEVL